MSEASRHGHKVTVRLPSELVATLPSGNTLSEQVRTALWQLADLRAAGAAGLGTQARLAAIEAQLSAMHPDRQTVVLLEAFAAMGADLVQLQKTLLPVFWWVDRAQPPDSEAAKKELEALLTRLSERNHRVLTEPRERALARVRALDEGGE